MKKRNLMSRLVSAFWTYGICCARMEEALISRAHYPECIEHGPHFGILVDNDWQAKDYRRWQRRAEIVEEWVESQALHEAFGHQG